MNNIIEKILNVTNEELNSLVTDNINSYDMHFDTSCYHSTSGHEHYRLLIYISTLFNGDVLFDVGTNACRSAMALSYNVKNNVKSFDVLQIMPVNPSIPNVEFIIGDCTKNENIYKTPLIFLDVNHDGIYENLLYNFLKSVNWKGVLVLDDINLNDEMRDFWRNIKEEKWDITSKGHWSGTGIVNFK